MTTARTQDRLTCIGVTCSAAKNKPFFDAIQRRIVIRKFWDSLAPVGDRLMGVPRGSLGPQVVRIVFPRNGFAHESTNLRGFDKKWRQFREVLDCPLAPGAFAVEMDGLEPRVPGSLDIDPVVVSDVNGLGW